MNYRQRFQLAQELDHKLKAANQSGNGIHLSREQVVQLIDHLSSSPIDTLHADAVFNRHVEETLPSNRCVRKPRNLRITLRFYVFHFHHTVRMRFAELFA